MSIFPIVFALFWLGSLLIDYGKWKQDDFKDINKSLYFTLHAATLVLFVTFVVHVRVPMPTEPFIRTVAPWVKSMMRGFFHA